MGYRLGIVRAQGSGAIYDYNAELKRRGVPLYGFKVRAPARVEILAVNLQAQYEPTLVTVIEQALTMPLPPSEAILCVRFPDSGALGAIAVLQERVEGRTTFEPSALRRIEMLAAYDEPYARPWRAFPIPTADNPWPEGFDGDLTMHTLREISYDSTTTVANRVRILRKWIVSGCLPQTYVDRAQAVHEAIIEDFDNLRIAPDPLSDGKVAYVSSEHVSARFIAYRIAPIVVASSVPPQLTNFKVSRFRSLPLNFDLAGASAALSELDPEWELHKSFCRSPPRRTSKLSLNEVLRVVRQHIR